MNIPELNLREIYPNYHEGDEPSPRKLVESMIILQAQEVQLAQLLAESHKELDSAKFQTDRAKNDYTDFIDECLIDCIADNSIPKEFQKNKETSFGFIKYQSKHKEMIKQHKDEVIRAERELADINSTHRTLKTFHDVVKNALSTATQVLSYLKHEEKMAGV